MVKLSKHAQEQMNKRAIRLADIEDAIALLDWQTPDATDPTLTRSFMAIEQFGGRILRVVHRPDGADVLVITATWDRGARRR